MRAQMPRRPRKWLRDIPLHINQQGNNRAACFFADEDYRFYLHWLRLNAEDYGCAIHAYVLMTNNVHLLLTPKENGAASMFVQSVARRYVQYVNRVYRRSGTLWEGRFKASPVDAERYLLSCYRYIELDPVRAGMVEHPAEYAWSSYRHHAHGITDPLITDHPLFDVLGATPDARAAAYRSLIRTALGDQDLNAIRSAVHRGGILGGDRFRDSISATSRVRAENAARGRQRTMSKQGSLSARGD